MRHLDSHVRLKLTVLCWLASAVLAPAASQAAGSAYVATADSGGTVKQFDVAADGTLTPKAQPSVPAATAQPWAIGITPDGGRVYVTNLNVNPPTEVVNQYAALAGGALAAFSPPTLQAGGNALAVAVTPDGRHVYVGSNYGAEGPKIFMYDVAPDGSLNAKTPAFISVDSANGLTITPDGKSIYSTGSGEVEQFDIAPDGSITPKTPRVVMAGSIPVQGVITPDGRNLYVPDLNDADVLQFDVGADSKITPKNPPTVPAAGTPIHSAMSPDGRSLYVLADGGEVSQYDVGADGKLALKTPPTVVAGTSGGVWVAVSPDSRSVYVTVNNYVAQFDAAADGTLTPKNPATVPIGSNPAGVALTPDQAPRAALTASPAPAGVPVTLDGSGSKDPDGAIARYDWTFGDGASAANGGPKQTHAYAKPGTYIVTLTETDNVGCSLQLVFTGQIAACNGAPGAQTSASVTIPGASVSSFALGSSTFRAAKKGASVARARVGTRVTYSLNGPAVVNFAVQRAAKGRRVGHVCKRPNRHNSRRKGCVRWARQRGSFSVTSSQPGAVSFRFTGRLNHKSLKPGRYRLVATPTSGGVAGVTRLLKFRIVR